MAIDSVDFSQWFGNEHSQATEIVSLWDQWDSQRTVWKDRVAEVQKYLSATSTRDTTNFKNDHNHTTHRPKLTQIADNLKANYMDGLLPNRNWLRFEGESQDEVNREKRMLLEGYLRTKHRLSGFREVISRLVDDWVDTGNAFCGVTFINESHTDATGRNWKGYRGPKVYRISPHDIVFNPLASDFRSAPKIVRTIKSLGELARDVEENPELHYQQEIFDRIRADRQNYAVGVNNGAFKTEDVNKHMQMTYDGFGSYTQYIESPYVEILEYYGDFYDVHSGQFYKNHVITVIDRRYVLRAEPLNTHDGHPYIFKSGWRDRKDNLWSMGPLDNLVGLQYRIDHLENARADGFDEMLIPDTIITGDVEIEYGPDGEKIYRVSENGKVEYLHPDTTILNADLQIQAAEEAMELYAGSPREAMGFRTAGEKTKFEVSSLMNAAGRIFQNKMTKFEIEMLETIVNSEIAVARANSNIADTVKIIDPDNGAAHFMDISMEDLTVNGKIVPIGARHFSRQQQLAQDLLQFQQGALVDPAVAEHFPAKRLAQVWEDVMGFDQFDMYQEFGRVSESVEREQLMAAARKQLSEQALTETEEPDITEEADSEGFEAY